MLKKASIIFLLLAGIIAAITIQKKYQVLPTSLGHITLKPEGSSWFLATYSMRATDAHHGINTMQYMPDGRGIITADAGDFSGSKVSAGAVIRYDLKKHKRKWLSRPYKPTLHGGNYPTILDLQVSPKGKYIAITPYWPRSGGLRTVPTSKSKTKTVKPHTGLPWATAIMNLLKKCNGWG